MPNHAHPRILATVVIIRDAPFYKSGSRICKAAVLVTEPVGKIEARFTLREQCFAPAMGEGQIMVRIAAMIPKWSDLLMRVPTRTPEYNALLAKGAPHLPDDDIQRLVKAMPRETGKLWLLHLTDEQMADEAAQIGFTIPHWETDWQHHCLYADIEVQALWTAFVDAFCTEAHALHLLAARQAWQALEQAAARIVER